MEASTDVVRNREGDIQSASGVLGVRTYSPVTKVPQEVAW
jgi:hypothetical protein